MAKTKYSIEEFIVFLQSKPFFVKFKDIDDSPLSENYIKASSIPDIHQEIMDYSDGKVCYVDVFTKKIGKLSNISYEPVNECVVIVDSAENTDNTNYNLGAITDTSPINHKIINQAQQMSNPHNQLLQFMLTNVQNELSATKNELSALKIKYDDLKEKYSDVKAELKSKDKENEISLRGVEAENKGFLNDIFENSDKIGELIRAFKGGDTTTNNSNVLALGDFSPKTRESVKFSAEFFEKMSDEDKEITCVLIQAMTVDPETVRAILAELKERREKEATNNLIQN